MLKFHIVKYRLESDIGFILDSKYMYIFTEIRIISLLFRRSVLVEIPHNVLTQKLLDSKNVFILDCKSDLFVW